MGDQCLTLGILCFIFTLCSKCKYNILLFVNFYKANPKLLSFICYVLILFSFFFFPHHICPKLWFNEKWVAFKNLSGHKDTLFETEIFPYINQIDMNINKIIPTKMYKKLLKERCYWGTASTLWFIWEI